MRNAKAIATVLAVTAIIGCNQQPGDQATEPEMQTTTVVSASPSTAAMGPAVPGELLGTWKAEVSDEWLKQFRKAYGTRMSEAEVDAAVAKIQKRAGRSFTIERDRIVAASPGGESKSQPFRVEAATATKATLVLDDPDRPDEPIRLQLVSQSAHRASIVYGIENMPELELRRQ